MKTICLVVCVLVSISIMTSSGAMVGGISDSEKPAGSEVNEYVKAVESEIKSSAMATLASGDQPSKDVTEMFQNSSVQALSYKSQVVAGINYFVKVRVADLIFHVRIYRDLQGNASLTKVIGPKAESDPIQYFS